MALILISINADVSVVNGQGFWMTTLDAKSLTYTGKGPSLEEVIEVELDAGWQLVGNPYSVAIPVTSIFVSPKEGDDAIAVNEDTISAKTFWYYNPETGAYEAVETIQPGKSVWIFIRQSGGARLFFVIDTDNITSSSSTSSSSELTKSTSRLAADESEPLPPAPPGGFSVPGGGSGGGGCLLKRR